MFPPEVKGKAMLACGRRCCLCHKFAGVAMECHHIDQKAKGGRDTFANCIPLCFDCHAEVGHYNDEHPKGVKFSLEELRGHRDRWYAMVSDGKAPDAPTGFEELDRKLYLRLYEKLGGKKMVHFRDHDYGNGYDVKVEHRLWDFEHEARMPQSEFHDAQMAAALADLLASLDRYWQDARNRLWHDGDRANIPPEWAHGEEAQQKRFEEAVEVMNKASSRVWEAFSQFVKTARFRLKFDHD
jgi:hypothetical protein